ncbi:MAG: putative molybdenum carrier protein [Elusimicrobia bacterium]|nr:putative molybdenum carrier protein [Elusimicrobiota bacterium]
MKRAVKFRLKKIVSGGQSGVDRAALDAAIKLKITCGGYVPKGRLAEDGRISDKYSLTESYSSNYSVRTMLNIKYSCATLILNIGPLEGGTLSTLNLCLKLKKPFKIIDIGSGEYGKSADEAIAFINEVKPEVLNIAGPRESKRPGIYKKAIKILLKTFQTSTTA